MRAESDRDESDQRRRWGESPAWGVYALCGLALTVVYFGLSGVAQSTLYNLIGLSALVAILAGVRRHRPVVALPWWLLAAGIV